MVTSPPIDASAVPTKPPIAPAPRIACFIAAPEIQRVSSLLDAGIGDFDSPLRCAQKSVTLTTSHELLLLTGSIVWARFTFFPRELPTRSLPAKWSSVLPQ